MNQLKIVLKFDHQLLITLLLISIKTKWKFLNKSNYSSLYSWLSSPIAMSTQPYLYHPPSIQKKRRSAKMLWKMRVDLLRKSINKLPALKNYKSSQSKSLNKKVKFFNLK